MRPESGRPVARPCAGSANARGAPALRGDQTPLPRAPIWMAAMAAMLTMKEQAQLQHRMRAGSSDASQRAPTRR